MVTAGSSIENSDAVNTFNSIVRNAAWNTIVYHSTVRHRFATDNITAPTGNYSTDNPSSGASVAGVGNNGTTITASTVYNHLNAATRNLTHIRNSRANFYRDENGTNVLRGSVTGVTVRPTSTRQNVPNVNNGGVSAGSTATAAGYNQYCTNLYNQWVTLRNIRSDFNVFYCHTSCHTSCHSSRGRR